MSAGGVKVGGGEPPPMAAFAEPEVKALTRSRLEVSSPAGKAPAALSMAISCPTSSIIGTVAGGDDDLVDQGAGGFQHLDALAGIDAAAARAAKA